MSLTKTLCLMGLLAMCSGAVAEQPATETVVSQVLQAAGGKDKLLRLFRMRERLNVSSDSAKLGNERISVLEPPDHWWLGKRDRVKENKEPATYLVWAWTLAVLTDTNSRIESLPEKKENDQTLQGLRISGTIEPPMDMFFETTTHQLVQIEWRADIHRFSDWKTHDGARYPAKCIGYRKNTGKPWYFTEILELERLSELPDGLVR